MRWFTAEGQLISLPEEQERVNKEQAEQARVQAEQKWEQERQRAERLAAFLRSQGIDPDQLPE